MQKQLRVQVQRFLQGVQSSLSYVGAKAFTQVRLIAVTWAVALLTAPAMISFADDGSAAFQAKVTSAITTIKTYAGISIPGIAVIGFAVLVGGGLSVNAKRWALGVLTLLIVGAIGLFIFAAPLAQALNSTNS